LATILTSISYLTPRLAPSLPVTTNAFCGFSFPLGKQVKKQNRTARERHKSYDISDRQSSPWRKRGTGVDPHCAYCSFWRVVHVRVPNENQRQIALVPSFSCHTDADMYLAHHTQTMLSQSLRYFGGPSLHSRRLDTVFPSLQALRIFCRDSLSDLLY